MAQALAFVCITNVTPQLLKSPHIEYVVAVETIVDDHTVEGQVGNALEEGEALGGSESCKVTDSNSFGIRQSVYPPNEAAFAAAQNAKMS